MQYIYHRPLDKPMSNMDTDGNIYMVEATSTIKPFDHTKIYRSAQFQEAMKYFDGNDTMTRNILLSVNEADQNVVMRSLADKLYKHIVDKVDDIDFDTIPNSQGDITKIDNYEQLVDCINIISEILQQYHQNTESIEIISISLQNMIDRTELFEKAYKLNVEMPMIIYNTIALSIVSATSYMISCCVEFVKSGEAEFNIALDKIGAVKTRDCILFKDLAKFNKLCASGEFDKTMDFVIAQSTGAKNFTGGFALMTGAGGIVVGLGLVLLIIPLIRELIFFFYYSRSRVSNYFDAQASLLTMNAYNIENNLTRNDKDKKEIVAKQRKIADFFKRIASKIKVETKTGEQKAKQELTKVEKEKYKTDEVLDKIPDSSNSVLF